MTRYNFGGSLADFAILPPSGQSNVVKSQPNIVTGTAWSASTGGTQYTDMLISGVASTVVKTDTNGFVVRFQGPDGVTEIWADFGGGSRFLLVAGASKVAKGELVVNVKDYGAVGDGVTTNEHTAINLAIVAGAGKTVYVPAGTYMVDATAGIKMWTAGVRLLLDPSAIIKASPNSASGYSIIEVNAADCVIEGGTIEGDGTAHTGGTGEQGHCITTAAGASRLRIQSVKVTKAWGDGIAIQGGAADVSVIDVTADDNRRQGMSIIQAVRPRVIGGVYKNTGLSQNTAPSAGIDVEPNSTNQVTDCVISGVTFSANRGHGLQVATASGGLAEVTITGCRSVGSTTGSGFYFSAGGADTIKAKLTGCHSLSNTLHGFTVIANKVELTGCTARSNTQYGFLVQDNDVLLVDPVAVENGRHGISNASTSITRTRIIGGVTRANSQTTTGTYINVDLQGNATVIGHMSDAGQLTNKPAYGFVIRTGVTARLIGCDVEGSFVTASLLDQPGNTTMLPKPGATRAAAITAPNTQTASYVQADVASLKTAIDAIRTVLTAHGLTS